MSATLTATGHFPDYLAWNGGRRKDPPMSQKRRGEGPPDPSPAAGDPIGFGDKRYLRDTNTIVRVQSSERKGFVEVRIGDKLPFRISVRALDTKSKRDRDNERKMRQRFAHLS